MDPFPSASVFEIAGLPLHPLLVHAVVILTPLTALALLLGTVLPAARRRLGIVTPIAALLLVALVPFTVSSGEALLAVVGAPPAVAAHEGYGRMLLPWVIAMFVIAAAQWAWFRWRRQDEDGVHRRSRLVTAGIGTLAVAVAAGTVFTVVLIGDSGARAVWGGILS